MHLFNDFGQALLSLSMRCSDILSIYGLMIWFNELTWIYLRLSYPPHMLHPPIPICGNPEINIHPIATLKFRYTYILKPLNSMVIDQGIMIIFCMPIGLIEIFPSTTHLHHECHGLKWAQVGLIPLVAP